MAPTSQIQSKMPNPRRVLPQNGCISFEKLIRHDYSDSGRYLESKWLHRHSITDLLCDKFLFRFVIRFSPIRISDTSDFYSLISFTRIIEEENRELIQDLIN